MFEKRIFFSLVSKKNPRYHRCILTSKNSEINPKSMRIDDSNVFFSEIGGGEKKTNSDIDIDNNNNWLASKSFFLFLLRTENKTKQKKTDS